MEICFSVVFVWNHHYICICVSCTWNSNVPHLAVYMKAWASICPWNYARRSRPKRNPSLGCFLLNWGGSAFGASALAVVAGMAKPRSRRRRCRLSPRLLSVLLSITRALRPRAVRPRPYAVAFFWEGHLPLLQRPGSLKKARAVPPVTTGGRSLDTSGSSFVKRHLGEAARSHWCLGIDCLLTETHRQHYVFIVTDFYFIFLQITIFLKNIWVFPSNCDLFYRPFYCYFEKQVWFLRGKKVIVRRKIANIFKGKKNDQKHNVFLFCTGGGRAWLS